MAEPSLASSAASPAQLSKPGLASHWLNPESGQLSQIPIQPTQPSPTWPAQPSLARSVQPGQPSPAQQAQLTPASLAQPSQPGQVSQPSPA